MRFLTAGESHGRALMGIIEGVPSGLSVTSDAIQLEMRRRKLGYGRGHRQQIEDDFVELVAGIRHGKTIGAPVGLVIWNRDFEVAWKDIMNAGPVEGPIRRQVAVPRPGHADLAGGIKYNHQDMRNVLERSSARETAMRVALGTIARLLLAECEIHVASRVVSIGVAQDQQPLNVPVTELNAVVDSSPLRCLGKAGEAAMLLEVEKAREAGDTVGGVIEIYAVGLPIGLGSYVQWDRRLEGMLSAALMSLNAIKGVEVGLGFGVTRLFGSDAHDEYHPPAKGQRGVGYRSNRSGGIDGGISTGQPLVLRAAMKPLATLMKPLPSINLRTGAAGKAHVERSDVCAVPSAAVIAESLVCLVLAHEMIVKFGGDSLKEIRPRVKAWRRSTS